MERSRLRKSSNPSLELADGFPTTEVLAQTLTRGESMLKALANINQFLLHHRRASPKAGEVFRQPQLASTLRAMLAAEKSAKGARGKKIDAVRDYFYRGPVAHKMGEVSEAHGGILTYDDIARFHAEVDTPRSVKYRGYEIVKPGFWTQGPVLLEMLNLLESYDLKSMGFNPRSISTPSWRRRS